MTSELTSMKEKEKKYKNRLRESERTLVMVANEKDELSAAKDKHTKSISQLQAQLQEAESMKDALDQQLAELENENQSLSNKSSVLEQSNAETKKSLEAIENEASRQKAEWMEEKTKLIEEKNKLKERIHESETTLVMVANQKTSLEKEKTDLERKLSSELIATEGKHSKKIAELQRRLEDTVSAEKKVCFLKAMPIHFLTTYVSSLISINNRIAP